MQHLQSVHHRFVGVYVDMLTILAGLTLSIVFIVLVLHYGSTPEVP